MIKYKLKCKSLCCIEQNNFDGWFQNIETFEKQMNLGLISCPICGDENIEKSLTTPSLKKIQITNKIIDKEQVDKNAFRNQKSEKITTILRSIKKQLEKNSTFVGDDFVKQARSMNEGLIEEKSIYGHGTKEEVDELRDEGVNVINVPWTPDDH
jgi:hypothetical protein